MVYVILLTRQGIFGFTFSLLVFYGLSLIFVIEIAVTTIPY